MTRSLKTCSTSLTAIKERDAILLSLAITRAGARQRYSGEDLNV